MASKGSRGGATVLGRAGPPNATRLLFGWALLALLMPLAHGCSTFNREGPEVTCEDLDGGFTNACRDGIIASCEEGVG
jgi:hypothetical protein